MSTKVTGPVAFFYEYAGCGWDEKKETPAAARNRNAHALAKAERDARDHGLSFSWRIDPEITSADWSDEIPAHETWLCCLHTEDAGDDQPSHIAGSLGGIDFGAGGEPYGAAYARVVEAELALEYLNSIPA